MVVIAAIAVLPSTHATQQSGVPIMSYFESLHTKPTPLWFCRGWIDGIKWRIPKPILCPLMPIDGDSKVVDVTVWWQDIGLRTLHGYECYAVKSVKLVTFYFFGAKVYDSWTKPYPVTELECRRMTAHRMSPDGEQMTYIRDGFFATKHSPQPSPYWCSTVQEEVINYYFVALKFTVGNADETVQTTTKLLENCHYSRGACQSELGHTIWNLDGLNSCRLRKGSSTACILTGKRLSCPELTMSTNNVKYVTLCGQLLGSGDTGLLFTQDLPQTIDSSITVTSVLEAQMSHPRKTRETNVVTMKPNPDQWPFTRTVAQPKFSSDKEINSRFQYLYDLVSQNVTYALQQFHIEICNTNKILLDMMRNLASGGNPTTLVRALLGEPSYTARLNGDVVSIWKCAPIYEYMFLHNNQCTVEHPVQYMDGHESRKGWVVPISHEIVDSPAFTTCPGLDFYFEVDDTVILLNNKSAALNLPVLPSPQRHSNLSKYEMPNLSFVARGAYSTEDISGQETILGMIRQMQSRYVLDGAVRSKMSGEHFQPQHVQVLDALSGIIMDPVITCVKAIITILVLSGFVLLFYTYRQKIFTIMCSFLARIQVLLKLNPLKKRTTISRGSLSPVDSPTNPNFDKNGAFHFSHARVVDEKAAARRNKSTTRVLYPDPYVIESSDDDI